MRITSKGQVTIPQEVRKELGLLPHTEVVFTVERGAAVIRPKARPRGRGPRIAAHLKSHGHALRMTSRELMALLRGRAG